LQNSSAKSDAALILEPRVSRRFLTFVAVAHIAAGAAVVAAVPAWWGDVSLCALVAASGMRVYLRHVSLTHAGAVVRLTWTSFGQWRLVTADGAEHSAVLQGDSYVHPWLVILNFKLATARTSVVLFPDSLHQEDFRRLRVRLRTAS
jgi:toxin CptA